MAAAPLPASIPAQDLVGRWGLAAYHKEEDRARTEAAARGQCRQPYNISRGPRGGVIMHLPDQSQPTELSLKGGPDGKNYIGPGEEPAGGQRDREIVTFDGRVLVTRFIDPEVSGRYGTSVYVRCGAETAPGAKKGAPKASQERLTPNRTLRCRRAGRVSAGAMGARRACGGACASLALR